MEEKENKVKVQEEQLQQREKKCNEREQNVMVREGAVSTKEEKWAATEKRMQENSSKLPSVIQFNVGMCLSLSSHILLFSPCYSSTSLLCLPY